MMNGVGPGLPIENGPINFAIRIPGSPTALHPLLIGKVVPPSGPLRGAQFEEAQELWEDVKTELGVPPELPYKSIERPQRFVSRVQHDFLQNSSMLLVGYVDGLRGSAEGIRAEEKPVSIQVLSARSLQFVTKLDVKAKTDADHACEEALKNITQQE
jgi:hypothetical protein